MGEIKVTEEASRKLGTTIASDVRFLPLDVKQEIASASPVPVRARVEELTAFQAWMDRSRGKALKPPAVRAQVLTQNYLCFVYLPESCFGILAKKAASGSTVKKCAQYLINGRIRSFRNAIAHANWCYRKDFGAIFYWARKGEEETLASFEVEQEELNFWQALSRCVAYATLTNIE
jgi:hypothetical protein